MSFNDIELRIKQLYSAINIQTELFSKKASPTQKEIVFEDGKKGIQISIGNDLSTEEDKLKAYSQIINIIHNLANFKDNLKKALTNKGLNKKIVEDRINNSNALKLIIDLSNQDKHGFPLTKTNRSNLNPTIENIKSYWNIKIPFSKIFHNPMLNEMIIDAEILDKNKNLIMYFSELTEKSTLEWENFILEYLEENSSLIKEIRLKKELIENKQKNLQKLITESYNLIEKNEWKTLPKNELKPGMILVAGENGIFDSIHRGLVTEIKIENNKIIIYLLTDFPLTYLQSFDLERKDFKIINLKNSNDIDLLTHYYQSFPRKYNEIISLIYN